MHAFVGDRVMRRAAKSAAPSICTIEPLENRLMLNATLTAAFAPVQLAPNATPDNIDLSTHFSDPTITGSPVVMQTPLGNIFLNLFNQQAPKTVANFLNYANNGTYDQTVIQRAVPGFILQGGGFLADQTHIPTGAPVPNEAGVSNTLGTIAMALNTDPTTHQVDPNSATSDWFINDANNTQLDAQKFTVFGQVIYSGMSVVNAIEQLPKGIVSPNFTPNVAAGDPSGGVLPLQNYNDGSPILPTNYVPVSLIRSILPLSFQVTSDNTALLDASASAFTLTLTPHAGNGIAHVTITATDVAGNQATGQLTVQVGSTQAVLGQRAARMVHFSDPDGTSSQISFSGAGTATVSFSGTNLTATTKGGVITLSGTPQGVFIVTTGTSASSALTLTGRGGNGSVDIAGITTDGPLRALTGKNTALAGTLTAAGAIGSLTLGSISNGTINLGTGRSVTINLGSLNNAGIFSMAPVTAVTAGSWENGSLGAPAVNRISIKGAFMGFVNASSVKAFSAGSITGGTWNVSGSVGSILTHSIAAITASLGTLGKLTVLGAISSSNIKTTGNISAISAASIAGSDIFAGVGSSGLPAVTTDFNAASTITSTKITGSFVNSNIAAQTLGKVSIGSIQPANNGAQLGFAAHQIKQLTTTVGGKKLALTNVSAESQVTAAFTAAAITPQDLVIRIV
ncbi:MAG TPA: peptidylprolyl isomerase [Tepidisphaeraceae bacterium]|nr:peptidylprolyl isomerase [Tepidisphaeraceae bacterium]